MFAGKHAIVVGLGFGDEGKGATVDALTSTGDYDLVVRFNGGQQAGHNVVLPTGKHHTFTQIGSGFFNGVPSHTSKYCTFDPIAFYGEADHLYALTRDIPYQMHTVSPDALLTTPLHQASNRMLEAARGAGQHGTVGVGFGETIRYALEAKDPMVVRDLTTPDVLTVKIVKYSQWLVDQGIMSVPIPRTDAYAMMRQMTKYASFLELKSDDDMEFENHQVVFEGAQGALLDEWHGFHPHTTWSTTTAKNAKVLAGDRGSIVIGCTRTYHTRHGAGPLQSEGEFQRAPQETHNSDDGAQGNWRTAPFSLPLFRYALDVAQPDVLSVTHLDVTAPAFEGRDFKKPQIPWWEDEPARLEEQRLIGESTVKEKACFKGFMGLNEFEKYVPVVLAAYGPSRADRQWLS